ncbi:MAG: hypothetical protein WD070_09475, partial [Pirellulaceae bacterium]
LNQGKLVIVFIFGLSAVMGGYAWWHHFTQGRRCVELWGAETGELIRYAARVEVLQLEPGDTTATDLLYVQAKPYAIVAQKDITGTQGLVHARQALIEDASFLWQADLSGPATWQYVLRFTDGDKQVSVAIDSDTGRVRLVGTDRQAVLKPHLRTAYQTRLPMWLGLDASPSQTSEPTTADTR